MSRGLEKRAAKRYNVQVLLVFHMVGYMVTSEQAAAGQAAAAVDDKLKLSAIEYLQNQTIKVALRDGTTLQGKLERIGWLDARSEGISYLCVRVDSHSLHLLTAQGINTRTGILFIPWDWVACVIVP